MAYKDEYEVARLYTDGSFAKQVADANSTATICASSFIWRRRSWRAATRPPGCRAR